MEAKIKRAYLNPRFPGSFSGLTGFKKSGNRKEPVKQIENVLKTIPAYTLHRSRRIHFPRRVVYAPYINAQWGMDLMDISKFSKANNGMHFLLTAIDIFSKRGYIQPLKNKSGIVVKEGIEKIFRRSYGIPQRVQTDLGLEFYNSNCKELMEKYKIKLFSVQSELKSCVVERFNRTILEKIYRFMTHNNTQKFVNRIKEIEHLYNTSYHRSIKCRPIDVVPAKQSEVYKNLYGHLTDTKDLRAEIFKVGDIVLISKVKKIFDKGVAANFQPEKFIIHAIRQTVPRTYILSDQAGQIVEGGFYREELQRISH